MNRPKIVTIVAWFLIVWNLIMLVVAVPQMGVGLVPLFITFIQRTLTVWMLFILVGIHLLKRKNWARVTYLVVGPLYSIINTILRAVHLGLVGIVDQVPSLIVTALFVIVLTRPKTKAWFLGEPQVSSTSSDKKKRPVWLPIISIIGAILVGIILLLWGANRFIIVAGPGDDRGNGIIEECLSK